MYEKIGESYAQKAKDMEAVFERVNSLAGLQGLTKEQTKRIESVNELVKDIYDVGKEIITLNGTSDQILRFRKSSKSTNEICDIYRERTEGLGGLLRVFGEEFKEHYDKELAKSWDRGEKDMEHNELLDQAIKFQGETYFKARKLMNKVLESNEMTDSDKKTLNDSLMEKEVC